MTSLYGDLDTARLMFGEHARHVPAFLYVQDQGPGTVTLAGASMTAGRDHPLTYGGGHHRDGHGPDYWPHHLIVGEIVVRPHVVIGTRACQGYGLPGLLTGDGPDLEELLADGTIVVGTREKVAEINDRYRRGAWREA